MSTESRSGRSHLRRFHTAPSLLLPCCTSFRATHPRTRPEGDGEQPRPRWGALGWWSRRNWWGNHQWQSHLWWVLRSHTSLPGTSKEMSLERSFCQAWRAGCSPCLLGHNRLTVIISRLGPGWGVSANLSPGTLWSVDTPLNLCYVWGQTPGLKLGVHHLQAGPSHILSEPQFFHL